MDDSFGPQYGPRAESQEEGNERSSSREDVSGCMDVLACNYDPEATIDDGSCEYAYFVMSEIMTNCNEACGDNICVGNLGQSWNDDQGCNIMEGLGGDCSNCQTAGPSVPWRPGWIETGASESYICYYSSQPISNCEIIGGDYGPFQRLCKCTTSLFPEENLRE